jgi:hypothetical protein
METIAFWIGSALGDKLDPQTWIIILAALWGVSEALSLIPAVKSNGVFQVIFNVLQRLYGTARKVR